MKKSNIFGKRLVSLVTAFVLALGSVLADITMRPLFGIEASAKVIVAYTVAFNANDGSEVTVIAANSDGYIEVPPTPTRDGYTFGGWYDDSACTTAHDFHTPLSSDVTLYAKWISNHTHSYGSTWKSDSTEHWHECSCGTKSGTAAHTEDEGVITTTSTGVKTYSCSVCGYVLRTETVDKLHTHSYGTEWKYDSTSHWLECSCGTKSGTAAHVSNGGIITTEPTSTSVGTKIYSCSVCGYIMRTETIPASGNGSYGDSGNNSGNNSGSNSNSGSDGAGNAGSYTGGKSEENTDNNSGGKSENEQPSETEEIIADEAADEEIEEIKETVPPKKVTKLKAKVKKNSKSPKVKKNSKSQKKKTGAIVTLSWRETDKNADGFLVEMYDPYKKKWIKKKLIKVEDDDYGSFHCTISGVGKGKISKKEYKFRITPYTEDENGEKVYGKSTTIKEKI